MQTDPFRKFYDAELAGPLNEIRQERENSRKSLGRTMRILAGILAALAVCWMFSGSDFRFFCLVGIGACGVFGLVRLFGYWNGTAEKQRFKQAVVPRLVRYFDPSLKFRPNAMISEAFYRRSCLFQAGYDRYEGEDLVSGFYKGVEVAFSELHTQYKTQSTDSKGRTTTCWHTIFDGVFFVADFHKDFKYRTFVLPDSAENLFGQLIGNFLQKCNLFQPGKLVRMENVEFEKAFAVYADDPIEARYVITPGMMERLLNLRRRFGSGLRAAFVDSCLFLAISSDNNFFELSSLHNFDCSVAEHCRDELLMFLEIVGELNLDRRIWSKK